MSDRHTSAYTVPPSLGYLSQAGVLDLIAVCRECSHVSILPIEELIEKVGPDRLLTALKGRCSVCGSNWGELRPHS